MTLNSGKINAKYVVQSINVDTKTKKRLQDMGITQGSVIKVMSMVGKHAFILRVRGSRVALGKEIIEHIDVSEYQTPVKEEQEGL